MKDVWAVTSGVYSDYSVVAIFESQDAAKQAAANLQAADEWREVRVETFPLYEAEDDVALVPSYIAYGRPPSMEIRVEEDGDGPDLPHYAPTRPKVRINPRVDGNVVITAVCGDRDAAIKAVKDRLAAAKAGHDLEGWDL